MIPMRETSDMEQLRGMHISLAHLIRFCMSELGMSRKDAEKKARREAEQAGVVLIEDCNDA